jgi:small-conductance mechanosensitive channel
MPGDFSLASLHVSLRVLAFAGIVVALGVGLDRLVGTVVDRSLKNLHVQGRDDVRTRLIFTRRLLRGALWLIVLAMVSWEIEPLRTLGTTLLASAGVAGLVVGMAARSTFANIVAGVQIAFTQPIRVGDQVTIRDETGEVEDITLFYTFVRTGDNRRLAIPNDVLSNEIIKNYSLREPKILSNARFFISYAADVEKTKKVLIDAARTCPSRDTKSEPFAGVADLTETSVQIKVYAWASTPLGSFDLSGELLERGLEALVAAKIDRPPTFACTAAGQTPRPTST